MAIELGRVNVGETGSSTPSDPTGYAGDVAQIIREMSGGTTRGGNEVPMTQRLDMTEADLAAIRYDAATNNVIVPIGPGAQKGFADAVRRYWKNNTTDIMIHNIVFHYRGQ